MWVAIVKRASWLASILLTAVAVAHLLRVAFGVQVTVADRHVPMWASWVAFVVAGGAAVMLWRAVRRMP